LQQCIGYRSVHEAVRDLTRAREVAMIDLKKKRNSCSHSCSATAGSSRVGRIGQKCMNAGWRSRRSIIRHSRSFSKNHLEVINAARVRLAALEQQLREIVPIWTMAPMVASYQVLRGVSFLVAVTFVAEVGDVRRFATPQQLMVFLGLVPSERTTGDTVRRGSITKTGNHRARTRPIEGAWTYRFSARVGETLRNRLKDLPVSVRSIAWKAQLRLCARYRRLIANGKEAPVATTAIARELAAFLLAIGQLVAPQRPAI
jgi:transposase